MKRFCFIKLRRVVAAAVVALVLFLTLGAVPSQAGPCERALGACLMENGLAMLIGLITTGGLATVVAAQFCVNGYTFCLTYVR